MAAKIYKLGFRKKGSKFGVGRGQAEGTFSANTAEVSLDTIDRLFARMERKLDEADQDVETEDLQRRRPGFRPMRGFRRAVDVKYGLRRFQRDLYRLSDPLRSHCHKSDCPAEFRLRLSS